MELTEKTIDSREIYKGVIVRVRLDQIQLPDGRPSRREVVEHPGGVGVLPLDEEGRVTVVRQYRYPFSAPLLEIPAGKLERGEDHRVCGLRELEEEVGLRCDEFTYLGGLYLSPGYSTEVLHLYLARKLHQVNCHPDEGEFLEIEKLPFDELYKKVMANEIHDAKTVAAVLKTRLYLGL